VAADKTSDGLLALHRRLLDGDPLASEEAARVLLVPLMEVTQRAYPRLDEQLITDAVVDALLDYFANPAYADQEGESKLQSFLQRAAWRNAANQYRGTRRRKFREERWLGEQDARSVEDSRALGMLVEEEDKAARSQKVADLMALLPDEHDRLVLQLRLDGERSTKSFAQTLGITHLTAAEQRKIVKQVKDRIDKVIKRGREQASD
jgi:RNA polymerase sigma-70 factor, ECF subfamily